MWPIVCEIQHEIDQEIRARRDAELKH
jgi:hypothetical protein